MNKILFIVLALLAVLALSACTSEADTTPVKGDATQTGEATETHEEAKLCCGGTCGTPEGYCCTGACCPDLPIYEP